MTPTTQEIDDGLRCRGCGEPIPPEARYFSVHITDCATGTREHPRTGCVREVTAIHSYDRYVRCLKCGPGLT